MQVNLFSTFREHTGTKDFDLDIPPNTSVMGAVSKILQRYPMLRRLWLDANDQLRVHVIICVNQTDVMALPDGMETRIKPDDILDIFPPITGG
ncbi:MAG: MoaD family protein [Anaerolineaceae bacterium]|nr:MoaD family protein [Anaerolineaceae bacterium]